MRIKKKRDKIWGEKYIKEKPLSLPALIWSRAALQGPRKQNKRAFQPCAREKEKFSRPAAWTKSTQIQLCYYSPWFFSFFFLGLKQSGCVCVHFLGSPVSKISQIVPRVFTVAFSHKSVFVQIRQTLAQLLLSVWLIKISVTSKPWCAPNKWTETTYMGLILEHYFCSKM